MIAATITPQGCGKRQIQSTIQAASTLIGDPHRFIDDAARKHKLLDIVLPWRTGREGGPGVSVLDQLWLQQNEDRGDVPRRKRERRIFAR